MRDTNDEFFVNLYIKQEVNYTLNGLEISRKSVNSMAGICSASAIVTTKAQYILNKFTEVETMLRLIARRVSG